MRPTIFYLICLKSYELGFPALSRAQSPAVTPRKIYVSRSQAVSRDCSPEKLLPLSQSARKLSTNKPPGDPKGNKSQTDGGGYISDEDGDTSQYGSQASLSGQRYAYVSVINTVSVFRRKLVSLSALWVVVKCVAWLHISWCQHIMRQDQNKIHDKIFSDVSRKKFGASLRASF